MKPAIIPWINHTKALGIFLVVLGHLPSLDPTIKHWIFSFHMPLFFILSGYLLRSPSHVSEWNVCVVNTFRSLLPAYLCFGILCYTAWLLVLRHYGQDAEINASPWMTLLCIPYGSGTPAVIHLQPNILWFFPCLILSQVIVFTLTALVPRHRILFSSALALLGFCLPQGWALPWELESALVAQWFVMGGTWLRSTPMENLLFRFPLTGVLLLLLGGSLGLWNEAVDMRSSQFGNEVLFVLSGVSTTVGLMLLLSLWPQHRVTTWIARQTIIIYPLHLLMFSAFSAASLALLQQNILMRTDLWILILASLLNVALLSLIVCPLLKKMTPWIYGLSKRPLPTKA